MNENNYANPYQQEQMAYGNYYQYAPANNVEWTQPLTQEEARSLKTTAPAFDILNVSKEEMIKSHCAHRDPVKKALTLRATGDGQTFVCTQCGEEFNIVDISEEEAEKYVNGIIDMLQTAKTFYVDLPPKTIDAYFQMIPFLKKLPKLYRLAHDTFTRATGSPSVQSAYMSGNPWYMMGQAVSGAYNGMPGYAPAPGYAPQAGYGYNQAGYYQAPPVPQQAPVNNVNPFMSAPAQQQGVPFTQTYSQPAQNGYQAQQAPAAQVPQQAPNAADGQNNNGTVTTNKQFDV